MTVHPTEATSSDGQRGLLVLCRTFPKLSETFVLGETLALQHAGFDVHVAALERPAVGIPAEHGHVAQLRHPPRYLPAERLTDWLTVAGMLVLMLPAMLRWRNLQRALRLWRDAPAGCGAAALWLATTSRMLRVRHIHVHYIAETAWIAAIAARLIDIPFSISAHAKDIYLGAPSMLRRLMTEASFTATCTSYNTNHLRALADTPEQVHCIYHGVDTAQFVPPTVRRAVADSPLLLAVGRFRAKKGFDVLIEACQRLRDRGLRLRCEIVGYGEEERELQARIDRHGLASLVTLVPPEPHEVLVQRFARAAAFALPCRIAANGDRDGIPNVVLEAMAMALPVVTTGVSGIPEVVRDGDNGLLVPPDDADALANAIARLLTEPGLAARLGASARRTVSGQFSWPVAAARLRDNIANAAAPGVPSASSYAGIETTAHAAEIDR